MSKTTPVTNSTTSLLIMNLEAIDRKCRKEIFNHFKGEILKDLTFTGQAKRAKENREMTKPQALDYLNKNPIVESYVVAAYFGVALETIQEYTKLFRLIDARAEPPRKTTRAYFKSEIILRLKEYMDLEGLKLTPINNRLKESQEFREFLKSKLHTSIN